MGIIASASFAEPIYRKLKMKCFGPHVRNGKTFYRNYGRELKNGKGLTLLESSYEQLPSEIPPFFQGE